MKGMRLALAFGILALVFPAPVVQAQTPSYDPSITLEQATTVIAAAEAEARRNNWNVVITIVDPDGIW